MSQILTCIVLGAALVYAQGPVTSGSTGTTTQAAYACDSSVCRLPNCLCPSPNPPGNAGKPPLFITLTFDDSVNSVIMPVIEKDLSFVNPNGCPLSATFFVSTQYTEYWSVQRLYSLGHEIAMHTMTHVAQPPLNQIVGAHSALNTFAGVPKSELTGFRTPFLNYTTQSTGFVASSGLFKYDSSMPVNDNTIKTWPYTMDNGPYIDCGGGSCSPNHKFPGLWQIPLYTLQNADGSLNAAMDPNPVPGGAPAATVDEIFNLYKSNFLTHYNGDRRPLGIYLHAALSLSLPNQIEGLVKFQKEVASQYSDVYCISNQKLLKWMAAPTDIKGALTSAALDCMMPAVDAGNVEICDGIDNTGDGTIDVGLVSTCQFSPTSGTNVYWINSDLFWMSSTRPDSC